ncbi:spermidine/spermine N(1)-acetyltransferase-like protein 1 isoform 2-T4 [Liasis olivaceus]
MAGIGNSMNRFRVRPAEPRDCPEILRLIKELAAYENMPEAVKITETDAGIVGFAMYYYTYDPWIGKLLYLEDFYVMDEYRGWGIGTELLKNLSQIAIDSNCSCMHFLVVVWNKPSIEYYMRHGACDLSTEEGWHLFRFDKEHLIRMAAGE